MENISITVTTILALLGGLTVFVNGASMIIRLFKPAMKIRDTVERNEMTIKEVKERFDAHETDFKMILQCLESLLEQDEQDNSEQIRETREQLNRFLIDRMERRTWK